MALKARLLIVLLLDIAVLALGSAVPGRNEPLIN
jgi:hypothetical protein